MGRQANLQQHGRVTGEAVPTSQTGWAMSGAARLARRALQWGAAKPAPGGWMSHTGLPFIRYRDDQGAVIKGALMRRWNGAHWEYRAMTSAELRDDEDSRAW